MPTQQWPDPDFSMTPCADCGMPCESGEYHPFAACLMFKACHNSDTVRANLAAVQDRARRPVEVSRLAEDVKAAQVVIGDETVNYGRNHERTIAARIAFHMTVDRLASMASTPVGEVPAGWREVLAELLWAYQSQIPSADQGREAQDAWADRCAAARKAAEAMLAASPAPAASKGAEAVWVAAFDEARDAILNDRGPLEGQGLTNDQTNAVLTILDAAFMPHLKRR